jgi:hypothetical protein
MKNQNDNQFEKEEDFDFFKKSKSTTTQKNLEQNQFKKPIEPNTQKPKLFDKFAAKKMVFICVAIVLPISVGMILNSHNTKAPVVVTHPALIKQSPVPIVIEATPGKNPEDPPNIDYSKVSKEDGERIKQALQQFHDITKQLKDTSKDINEQKK